MSLPEHRAFVHVSHYRKRTVYKTKGCRGPSKVGSPGRGKRGVVSGLSPQSVDRLRDVGKELESEMHTWVDLTYPLEMREELTGPIVKAHLHHFLVWLKRVCGPGLLYLWVMEFMKNGLPHIHMVISTRFEEFDDLMKMRHLVAQSWFNIVGSGLQKHLEAGTGFDPVHDQRAIGGYFAGYLSKQDQKKVPEYFRDCGRFWGCTRGSVKPLYDAVLGFHSADDALRAMREHKKMHAKGVKYYLGLKGVFPKLKRRNSGITDRCLNFESRSRLVERVIEHSGGEVVTDSSMVPPF